MTFDEAKRFVMPFGRYRGMTFDEISRDGDGLQYLHWLRGVRDLRRRLDKEVDDALAAYLDDPTIARELAGALEQEEEGLAAGED